VAEAIKSTQTDPAQYLIAMKYINAFSEVVKNNDKTLVVPYESSAMLGSLQSIKEIFQK